MFFQRLLVAVLLLPLGLWALFHSETSFAVLMAVVLTIAAWEYSKMFKSGGYRPAVFVLLPAIPAMTLVRAYLDDQYLLMVFVAGVLISAGYHIWMYEKGRDEAVEDLLVSIGGLAYIGILGSFFSAIRGMPNGEWWLFAVLTSVWWADVGGYLVGSLIGKRPLTPRLSPKKTWEGYLAGGVIAIFGAPFLRWLLDVVNLPVADSITIPITIIFGVMMGFIPTLGDLTISMLKRYFGVKHSGKILLGHGGILDRIDSWLWAVGISYYLIKFIFLP